jgi:hypothetical protein
MQDVLTGDQVLRLAHHVATVYPEGEFRLTRRWLKRQGLPVEPCLADLRRLGLDNDLDVANADRSYREPYYPGYSWDALSRAKKGAPRRSHV